MHVNVATLLQEPVGSMRRLQLDAEPVAVPDDGYERVIDGSFDLIRTVRGVLVRGVVSLETVVECSRCLEPFTLPLRFRIEEEFIPDRDPVTGEPIRDVDPEAFRIGAHHLLDLSEAVRQYEQTAMPLIPICRPDCAGLCPRCGQNRNNGSCACAASAEDARWGTLAGLADRLRMEITDGPPEA